MILGLPWLREHNPEINWVTEEVTLSQCPDKCKQCFWEVQEENRRIHQCRKGPFPSPTVEEESAEEEEEVSLEIEEGDQIFTTVIHTEPQQICAMENISQCLAAAHHCNTVAKSFREAVPSYLHEFEDMFAEEFYDVLPE